MANNRNRSDDFDDFSDVDNGFFEEGTANDASVRRGGSGGGGRGRGGIGDAFRNRPAFRLLVLVGVAALAVVGVVMFTGSRTETANKAVTGGAAGTTAPGAVQNMNSTAENERDASSGNRADNAQRGVGSSVPDITGNTLVTTSTTDGNNGATAAPLTRWRDSLAADPPPVPTPTPRTQAPPPERNDTQTQQQAQQPEQPQQPRGPDPREVAALSSTMRDQMESLTGAWTPKRAETLHVLASVTDSSAAGGGGSGGFRFGRDRIGANGVNVANSDGTPGTFDASQGHENQTLVNSGTILYAQLRNEANSDVPGPVLAEVLTGPMAGASVIGKFDTTRDMMHIVITFNRLVIDEDEYDIDAIAIDPNNSLPGLASETDGRYFDRMVLPAAASFLQGFAEAISQVGTDTFVSDGTVSSSQSAPDLVESVFAGVTLGAGVVGQVLNEEAQQTQRLVRVAAGTPVGIFFVQPMTEDDLDEGVNGVGGTGNPRGTTSVAQGNGTGQGQGNTGTALDLNSIGTRGGPSPTTTPISSQVNLGGSNTVALPGSRVTGYSSIGRR